jgi:hypothetical protein
MTEPESQLLTLHSTIDSSAETGTFRATEFSVPQIIVVFRQHRMFPVITRVAQLSRLTSKSSTADKKQAATQVERIRLAQLRNSTQ